MFSSEGQQFGWISSPGVFEGSSHTWCSNVGKRVAVGEGHLEGEKTRSRDAGALGSSNIVATYFFISYAALTVLITPLLK